MARRNRNAWSPLSKRVDNRLHELDLTYVELATELGVTEAAIRSWRTRHAPSEALARDLAVALRMPLDELWPQGERPAPRAAKRDRLAELEAEIEELRRRLDEISPAPSRADLDAARATHLRLQREDEDAAGDQAEGSEQ